jgi:hypothetical protein
MRTYRKDVKVMGKPGSRQELTQQQWESWAFELPHHCQGHREKGDEPSGRPWCQGL